MNRIIIRWLVIVFILIQKIAGAQSPASLYTEAQMAYQNKDYKKAINRYQLILKQDAISFEVYYNLGNAYFKCDSIGRAIQYYEKARKIAGDEEDIMYNLKIAQSKTVDKIEPMPEFIVTSTWRNLVNTKSADLWGNYSLFNFCFVFILLVVFRLVPSPATKKIIFATSGIFLLLAVWFYMLAQSKYNADNAVLKGVLIDAVAEVKSAPSATSTDLFVIHEGIHFKILAQQSSWCKIRLDNGNVGWISNQKVGEI